MKVLVTGKDSYIGDHIKLHMEKSGHRVDIADTFDYKWKEFDFSIYDAVVHVAAIVHQNAKIASSELFEKVNTILPLEIAQYAKANGVGQFVFISTMGVYGVDKSLNKKQGIITESTPLLPEELYGKSKLEAEIRLKELEEDSFKVAIVRPPSVYGYECRGNYISLFKKIADLMIVCPEAYTEIRQSMIYIDNLSELIKLIIEEKSGGVFMPQDEYAPNTVELITIIRGLYEKNTIKSKLLGLMVKLFSRISIVKKLYGGVMYSMSLSDCFESRYRIVSFKEGIEMTYKRKISTIKEKAEWFHFAFLCN